MTIKTEKARSKGLAPGPKLPIAKMLFGNGGPEEQLDFLLSAARDYGPVVGFRWLNRRSLLLDHPNHIEYVLRINNRNYLKSKNYDPVRLVVGEGLIVSEGEFWRRQRRLAQPAFHRKRIASLASLMVDETEAMLERWASSARGRGEPFDLHREIGILTLKIVAKALFGADVGEDAVGRISEAQTFLNGYVDSRMGALPKLPHQVPTPHNVRYRLALKDLEGIVYSLIDRRRRDGGGEDLLSMLLEARDQETGEGIGDVQLRNEVMTLLIAGNETTAVALSWTWYLLSGHPAINQKLHEELDAVLGGRAPTFEDLPRLSYTTAVLKEAMRLYPPAWIFSRRPVEDDEIGGYRVSAGTTVLISPYVTHRNPVYWEDPQTFNPERFEEGRSADRPEFAYLPFGGGPRKCIGDRFALVEGVLVLATVAQRYNLRLAQERKVAPEPLVTLRPKEGIPIILEERS
ncbi:MAG: Cytochrome P450 family protein [uncultured Rubrobacteraceae bacterium]|uniref:Cytochrome P450 family protein n=1 Tax=uncultured Rubrobacteraceae bacterium TaxID=349277 RepID=A0A6J4QY85_9ACTN|nr:MAG: Cytochrome P450 family protein [uncultured Rubrobacteraceae bacterium]